MESVSLAVALEASSKRNASIATLYKEEAKTILSRSISSLALSLADQRKELGKALLEFAGLDGTKAAVAELETRFLEAPAGSPGIEPCDFLEFAIRTESSDYELLACLAGAFLPLSSRGGRTSRRAFRTSPEALRMGAGPSGPARPLLIASDPPA